MGISPILVSADGSLETFKKCYSVSQKSIVALQLSSSPLNSSIPTELAKLSNLSKSLLPFARALNLDLILCCTPRISGLVQHWRDWSASERIWIVGKHWYVYLLCVSDVFSCFHTSFLLRAKEQLITANNSGSLTGSIPKELDRLTRLRKFLLPCVFARCHVHNYA